MHSPEQLHIDRKLTRTICIIAGGFELLMSIPVASYFTWFSLGGLPSFIGLALHVGALVLINKDGKLSGAPKIGIAASLFSWVPVIGWFLHVVTAATYFIQLFGKLHLQNFSRGQKTKVPPKQETASHKSKPRVRDAEIVD